MSVASEYDETLSRRVRTGSYSYLEDWHSESFDLRWVTKALTFVSIAFFAVYIAAVASTAWLFPFANWDTIAYSAAVERSSGLSAAEVHSRAYATVRQEIDAGAYKVLTEDRPYRVRQATDPGAFSSMLPFYETKKLYIASAKVLSGYVSTYDALRALSAGSVIVLGLITALWMGSLKALPWIGAVAVALGMSEFGFVAANTVPDLFAAIFVLLAGWAIASSRHWLVPVAIVLAVLTRPDHVAFAGVLMVVAFAGRLPVIPYVTAFALAFAAYLFASTGADHPGWWVQFWFTNVEYVGSVESFAPDFSLATYAMALVQSVVRAITRETWVFVTCGLFLIAGWQMIGREAFRRTEIVLIVSLLLTWIAKYLIFPLHEVRFHIAYILVLAVVAACGMARVDRPDARL